MNYVIIYQRDSEERFRLQLICDDKDEALKGAKELAGCSNVDVVKVLKTEEVWEYNGD